MRFLSRVSLLSAAALVAGVLAPPPAPAAGGMSPPSSGTIGTTGLFLACRSGSSASSTEYFDQQNVLRTWDCGPGMRPHKGVDILGPSTTPGTDPVFAAAAGTVWTAERGNGLGWRVVLRHAHGLGGSARFVYTIYGHLGDCSTGQTFIHDAIVPGASVAAGQLVGWQGDDSYPGGCAGRSHVHWEVRASETDVSNVFLATPASPTFYTGVALTADDLAPATSVTASPSGPVPTRPPPPAGNPPGGPPPTTAPSPQPGPAPAPNPLQVIIDILTAILRWLGVPLEGPEQAGVAPASPDAASPGPQGTPAPVLEASGRRTVDGIDRTWWSPPPAQTPPP